MLVARTTRSPAGPRYDVTSRTRPGQTHQVCRLAPTLSQPYYSDAGNCEPGARLDRFTPTTCPAPCWPARFVHFLMLKPPERVGIFTPATRHPPLRRCTRPGGMPGVLTCAGGGRRCANCVLPDLVPLYLWERGCCPPGAIIRWRFWASWGVSTTGGWRGGSVESASRGTSTRPPLSAATARRATSCRRAQRVEDRGGAMGGGPA
jgi:hypothetical protein